jgi:hypothetical protein
MPPKRAPITDGGELQKAWSRGEPDGYDEQEDGAPVSQQEAGYLPPEQGPFSCQNCEYFVADNQPCQKVAEPIMADGICKLFEKSDASQVPEGAGDSAGADAEATASYS